MFLKLLKIIIIMYLIIILKYLDFSKTFQDGGTPLFVACQCNHLEVVEELLKHNADLNCQMVDGASPLFISSQNGHLRMVKFLLSKGANVSLARKVKWVYCSS